jgi:hypothetical protein
MWVNVVAAPVCRLPFKGPRSFEVELVLTFDDGHSILNGSRTAETGELPSPQDGQLAKLKSLTCIQDTCGGLISSDKSIGGQS